MEKEEKMQESNQELSQHHVSKLEQHEKSHKDKNSNKRKQHASNRDSISPLSSVSSSSFVSSRSPQLNTNKMSEYDEEVSKINEKRPNSPRSSRSPLSTKPSTLNPCPNEDDKNKNKLDENLLVTSRSTNMQNQTNDVNQNENKENHQEKTVESIELLNTDTKSCTNSSNSSVICQIKEEAIFNLESSESGISLINKQEDSLATIEDHVENTSSIQVDIKVENNQPEIENTMDVSFSKGRFWDFYNYY
jgi:hypothetical protein